MASKPVMAKGLSGFFLSSLKYAEPLPDPGCAAHGSLAPWVPPPALCFFFCLQGKPLPH